MVVLGQYNSVLLCIKLYWVSKGLVCLYILEKMEIWWGDTDASHTHYSQTTEYRATQLVSSIKHKLSHAMHADRFRSCSHSRVGGLCAGGVGADALSTL